VRSKLVAICVVLAIPFAVAAGQRGGRSAAGRGGGAEGGAPRFQRPATAGQVEDLNPARMLLDKRKKLSLADSQVAKLKVLEKTIAERNRDLIAQYDSVRRQMRFPNVAPGGGELGASMGTGGSGRGSVGGGSVFGGGATPQSEEAAALLRSQTVVLHAIGLQLRERRPADLAEALAVLTPQQAKQAEEFVNEQNEEFDRILPAGARRG